SVRRCLNQIHQWRKATFRYSQGEDLEGDQGVEHPNAHFFPFAMSLTFPTPYPAGTVTSSRQSLTNLSSVSDGNIPGLPGTIILLESARALNLYDGIPWLHSVQDGSILELYSPVFKYSISVADVGYMCISSIISVSVHELGHALAATSEGIQIEYTALFLAVIVPGALVAFNNEMLQMMPCVATLRIYCAGVWHNAADESCSTPIHMPGLAWAEITFSRPYSPECQRVGNKMHSSYNNSGSGENSCSGTFVFIGDMMSMARSIWLTEYQSRWLYGVAYIPAVVEKMLVNTFHVSLMLVVLNSLPVYHLDGESILEVALCCFGSLTPTLRKLDLMLVIS
ncbi:Peptidase M50, partial [Cynara cardunculus var. scolymus]